LETIPPKDIAVAALGASAALAAVLLVFVGFLFSRADSIPGEVPNSVGDKFRFAAALGLVPVIVCASVMLASYEWLFHPASDTLWVCWRWGFWLETITFVVYACVAVRMLGKD
jgi:hypothetical protein